MREDIINADENFVKVVIQNGECLLNWLARYYRDCDGKLVMLDDQELLLLLNHSKCNRINWEQNSDANTFTLIWDATDEFPETIVKIASRGQATFIQRDDGEMDIVPRDLNWNIIEMLEAGDIIDEGCRYAENMVTDKQKLFLVADNPENEYEMGKPKEKSNESEMDM